MSVINEFRQFIQRGNVIDLAVGVIMGAAFGKIINSLVADVIMPPIGFLVGGVKFTDLKFKLPVPSEVLEQMRKINDKFEPPTINYGNFLQTLFDFLIIAFCVFLLVKGINALQKKKEEEAKPAEMSTTEKLLVEIRDSLKAM